MRAERVFFRWRIERGAFRMATAASAEAKTENRPKAEEHRLPPRAYEDQRLQEASINQGEMLILVLPGDEVLKEGSQDCSRFSVLGPRMHPGQWLQVTNDAESWFAVMRVSRIFGGRGQSIRGLELHFLFAPQTFDRTLEQPSANGEPYARWGGLYFKWQVIAGNGTVKREFIDSEIQAKRGAEELGRGPAR
jgi:hypothetical protein